MSERLTPSSPEINNEQKSAFVERVLRLAPYTDQYIDDFGVYGTHYEIETGYVTLYIPMLADHCYDEEFGVVDKLSVMVRDEEEFDGGLVQVRIRDYGVHLGDNLATYSEKVEIFDLATHRRVTSKAPSDLADVSDLMQTNEALGLTRFTEERLTEVNAVLDQLQPTDGYHGLS